MKNKNLVIGLIVIVAVIAGIAFINKTAAQKAKVVKTPPGAKPAKAVVRVPAKKTFSKNMGGLTVKIANSKGKEIHYRLRAFKVIDAKSSQYMIGFSSNKMQEFLSGNYDVEVESIPPRLYKNIRVSEGRETVEDLGLTGAINIKALNSKKKEAYLAVRVLYPKSNIAITGGNTGRPLEMMPGIYDIEVATSPRQVKKDLKVAPGEEVSVDLGVVSGLLVVKAIDQDNKAVRLSVRVKNAATNEQVAYGTTNQSLEVAPGTYAVEISSLPGHVKSGVKISAGEEAVVEFSVQTPSQPAPPKPAPAKPQPAKR